MYRRHQNALEQMRGDEVGRKKKTSWSISPHDLVISEGYASLILLDSDTGWEKAGSLGH